MTLLVTFFPKSWRRPVQPSRKMQAVGDAARDVQDWPGAETAYRQHLELFPQDVPIWVQFGHTLKEQGKRSEAVAAYRNALAVRADDADAALHLSHLLKQLELDAGRQGGGGLMLASQPAASIRLPDDPAKLRETAATARAAGDWPVAAMALRRLLQKQTAAADLHLQYGDMLQELGLLAQARAAFERAGLLEPHDPAPLIRCAALARTTGALAESAALLIQARGRGADVSVAEQDQRDAELMPDLVHFEDEPRPEFRVFLSSVVAAPRSEVASEVATFLGLANYSYSFSMRGFVDALDRLGVTYEIVSNPEYISDVRTRSDCAVNIHLGFYPPDAQRLLKGAYNIAIVAWEFERLPLQSEIISYHAFSDPNRMLALPDEIWSMSSYGAEAIRGPDRPGVHTVPTPVLSDVVDEPRAGPPTVRTRQRLASRLDRMRWVPLAIVPQMLKPFFEEEKRRASDLQTILFDHLAGTRAMVFLAIVNVHDYRKQIKPVVEAFLQVTKFQPAAVLLLKLSVGGTPKLPLSDYMFRYQMTDGSDLPPPYVSDRIWMTADVLSREELTELYDLADFYVSTPHGEGQNLPLIEAMARGVVPVSVDHTAMRDYIDEDNAVIVRSTLAPFNTRLADRYKMSGLRTYYVSARDTLDAFKQALALSPAEYAAKSGQALAAVRRVFGLASFEANLQRAVEAAVVRQNGERPQ